MRTTTSPSALVLPALRDRLDAAAHRAGWEPRYRDFETGLAATIDWYRENEDWWAPAKTRPKLCNASKGQ